jgi:endoglucanase
LILKHFVMKITLYSLFLILAVLSCKTNRQNSDMLAINDKDFFEVPGLNVMVFEDIYPEGHQGGIGIIQHGIRVATNGDLRLEPTPGQWQPIPKVGKRTIDRETNEIKVNLWFPDSNINRKGYNPIIYPDLRFTYKIRVKGEKGQFRIFVDLDEPIPVEWIGKVGFNMELYPAVLFGKTWIMDSLSGIFTRQANGPVILDNDKENQALPFATGKKLTIAPESDLQRMVIESSNSDLQLLDGRIKHTNGWFVVRSLVPEGTTRGAVEWIIRPNTINGWKSQPVVHISQVGYHTKQPKIAVIEIDPSEKNIYKANLIKVNDNGEKEVIKTLKPKEWGIFLRYKYLHFDFSEINKEGVYLIRYADVQSNPFIISADVYKRHVWQPTLEYFLPVQMCHMRVNDVYKVWHGVCHLDDALMAPIDTNHFDGYRQGSSTLTRYKPGDHVNGLNSGGWHDAGDDDLRIESQAGTVQLLSLAWEEFNPGFDATTIDQRRKLVEIHQPDGQPDILQQIEHGVLTILGGYESMGRVYRGIISPTIPQYTLVGDVSNQTNNINYDKNVKYDGTLGTAKGLKDDRMVFTEENPAHEFIAVQALASAARVLKEYNHELADRCIRSATELWHQTRQVKRWGLNEQIKAASELLISTGDKEYSDFLVQMSDSIKKRISSVGWIVVRTLTMIEEENYRNSIKQALIDFSKEIEEQEKETPFGVPYRPYIWGAGWNIQEFGVHQYYLLKYFPDLFNEKYMYNALNFVLGCHPGENTSSFASGVGSRSVTIAYGYNRADWFYIPGGVVSGTALIRPDFPELKEFPFLWQQTEYVLGGGGSNYLFLVLAVDKVLGTGD